jgi:hypothetical protein
MYVREQGDGVSLCEFAGRLDGFGLGNGTRDRASGP